MKGGPAISALMRPEHTFTSRVLPLLLVALCLTAACGGGGPVRETVDGVEYVRNPARPISGDPLPDPITPADLLVLTAGEGNVPGWTAVRDVRAVGDTLWAVTDMHLGEIALLDHAGNLLSALDLTVAPLAMTSPIAGMFTPAGRVVAADMALRRVVVADGEGRLLAQFPVEGGLPVDLEVEGDSACYVLLSEYPLGGREQITQIRCFSLTGMEIPLAGQDSLLVEYRSFPDARSSLPLSLSLAPEGQLYAAGLDYTVIQLSREGTKRVISRQVTSSRLPDYVLELRRNRMAQRPGAQQATVPLTETAGIAHLVALDGGGFAVQTNEWHPVLLDEASADSVAIVMLDLYATDGTFLERHAVELPLPRRTVHLTDESSGLYFGYAVPMDGDGPLAVIRFRIASTP